MDLKEYEQAKFALAEIIRSAHAIDTKDEALHSECRELLTRLAEDRFNLLVVGRFSRGKSTLMNALLGGDYLPTGIVPLTSAITTVRYGTRKQVVLIFNDSGLHREVPLSHLADYVTQQANPGNIKNIAYAEIQLPVEILRRGFFFVDSPGLGSSIVENTETTERFLPEADAFVLVTSYESPLSEEENRILQRIRHANKKLFVVVNKQDTVSTEERAEVLKFVGERLKQFSFSEEPQVFSISARQATGKKQPGNEDLLDESGLRSFQSSLLRFLTEERAQLFFSNMYARVSSFLMLRARSLGSPEHEEAYNVLMGRLHVLREKTLGVESVSGEVVECEKDSGVPITALQLEKRTGCRVCGAIFDAIFHFLSKYQYELTINSETQRDHARRGGFCPLHTWQYENISSPYGVCTAYPELAHRVARELRELASRATDVDELHENITSLLPTVATCRVCEVRIAAERKAVLEVADAVREMAGSNEERLPACCLPHLVATVGTLRKGKPVQSLLNAHAYLLERTAEDLQRYALRHDALRRYLTSEEERQSAQLILLLLAGHRSINAPWSVDSLY